MALPFVNNFEMINFTKSVSTVVPNFHYNLFLQRSDAKTNRFTVLMVHYILVRSFLVNDPPIDTILYTVIT